ncbi:ETHYLENE-INSENSITIVE3-like 1 protein isoform X1 [Iris pallida]|uniref:ETHYLENE-INSENSITIVE3-like 1 protein isoform X1 n=1 Tax=Iris pallida TaxID=29817 RepID=A0AAX6HUL7_IRIPA|nr:ETHYLENE-INSENSITIVE3-like 1 protein isoform X1 [Iris pallida]
MCRCSSSRAGIATSAEINGLYLYVLSLINPTPAVHIGGGGGGATAAVLDTFRSSATGAFLLRRPIKLLPASGAVPLLLVVAAAAAEWRSLYHCSSWSRTAESSSDSLAVILS